MQKARILKVCLHFDVPEPEHDYSFVLVFKRVEHLAITKVERGRGGGGNK